MNTNAHATEITRVIKQAVAREIHIPEDRLRVDEPFERYGIESVMSVAIVRRLEETYGELSKTLLFEYQTIASLADYLVDNHAGSSAATPSVARAEPPVTASVAPVPVAPAATTAAAARPARAPAPGTTAPEPAPEPVAAAQPARPVIRDGVRLLGRAPPSDAAAYLQQYGSTYRDGRLKQAAERAAAVTPASRGEAGPDLRHLLIATPSSDTVELFATGDGVPVLLLPAVGLTAPTWIHQLTSPLRDRTQLIVPHPPGYGLSKPVQQCNTRGIAGTFSDVIDFVAAERPVHLVASCLSCVSAVYLARFAPEKIASMTLVGAFHDTSEMTVADPDRVTTDELTAILTTAVERVKSDFAAVTDGAPINGKPPVTGASPDLLLGSLCANSLIAMRYLNEMLTFSLLDWLPEIRVPTQCIYGTNDRIVSPGHSERIAKAIPGARLIEIRGAGHFPYLTHSTWFNPLVAFFIAEHEPAVRAPIAARGRS